MNIYCRIHEVYKYFYSVIHTINTLCVIAELNVH